MKNLIRMSLFIIARVGLVLAVVAWSIGQRWGLYGSVESQTLSLSAAMVPLGWVAKQNTGSLRRSPTRPSWTGSVERLPSHRNHEQTRAWAFDQPGGDYSFYRPTGVMNGLGIIFAEYPSTRTISIRHWVIVTFFALFFALLKCMYRKRRDEMEHVISGNTETQ